MSEFLIVLVIFVLGFVSGFVVRAFISRKRRKRGW